MSERLKLTRNNQILKIVSDNPKANTIDGPLSRAMGKVFAEFLDDPEVQILVRTITGNSRLVWRVCEANCGVNL